MKPKVDVLICAHNEAGNIAAVLQSLRAQSAGPGEFRVIVVDNNSTDDTAGIAAQHAGELDLTIVKETRTGLNYARNTGYLHAETEYYAFERIVPLVSECGYMQDARLLQNQKKS